MEKVKRYPLPEDDERTVLRDGYFVHCVRFPCISSQQLTLKVFLQLIYLQ